MPRPLIKAKEVGDMLGFSSQTILNNTEPNGEIPCIRIGASIRYRPEDIEAIRDRRNEPADTATDA